MLMLIIFVAFPLPRGGEFVVPRKKITNPRGSAQGWVGGMVTAGIDRCIIESKALYGKEPIKRKIDPSWLMAHTSLALSML